MSWRQIIGREPLRSRLLIVAAGVLSIAGPACVAGVDRGNPPWWFNGLGVAFTLLPLAVVFMMVAVGIWAMTPKSRLSRPARFQLTNRGFAVAPMMPYGLAMAMPVILAGWIAAGFPQRWREVTDLITSIYGILTGGLILVTMVATAAAVISAWPGFAIELTPSGLFWRGPLFYRSIPWEALALGGPPRPELRANRLDLAVTRPDLVVQRGFAFIFGTRQRPALPLQVDVHPWVLADAIRWYAEHPADRRAIGTDAEHQRLVAALTGATATRAAPAP